MSELIEIAEEALIKPILSLKNVQLIEQSDSSTSSASSSSSEQYKLSEENIDPPLTKVNSQEAKEFMAKYGELKKKNGMLRSSKSKSFDSADYFIKNRNDKLKKEK